VRALRWASWQLPSHCEWYQIRDQICITQHSGDEKWSVTVRLQKSVTAFSLYMDFWSWKWLDIFIFRSVVDTKCHFFQLMPNNLLLLTPHWWQKFWSGVVYTCNSSAVIYLQKSSGGPSQTPQLEGLAALAPRTPYFLGDVRTSYASQIPLSVCCLSSVTSLHPSDRVELFGNILHHLVA